MHKRRNGSSTSSVPVAVAGAASLAVAMGVGRFGFTPMVPLMVQAGELGTAAAGWIAAANYVGYLLGAMTAARLPWGPREVSLASLVLTVLLTAAMAAPLPVGAWLLLRFLAGVASAWAFVATSVWCLGALGRLQRPSWAGGVYAGVGAGIALVGLYCLVSAAAGSSAASLWLQLGVLALALTIPVAWVLRGIEAPAVERPRATQGTRMPAGLTGIFLCYGALGFGYILPATFLPLLAHSVIADARVFGLAWPIFGTTAAVSTLAAGWLVQRFQRLHVWAVAHVLMAIGAVLPGVRATLATITLSALLVGGTFMVVTMVGMQEIRARASGAPAAALGRMTAAFALGQIAGPVLSSLLARLPGLAGRALYVSLDIAAASLLASASWLWLASRAGDASVPQENMT